jgi:hypothetical protein
MCAMVMRLAFGICGKNVSSVSVIFSRPSSMRKDHHRRVCLGDRPDSVLRVRGQRFLLSVVDQAVAEGAAVDHLPVPGDGQASHPLVLFEEPVEQQIEFGGVEGLGVTASGPYQHQQGSE